MTDVVGRLATALAERYVIERELGAGGMATVYLAHDVRHDRKVALKVLRPELAAILGGARFLSEIKTTANLQHPHILSLFDSGEADGTVYYVMPYVEGESLRDRLVREKQLPVEDALRIAREVADALDYAHGHGIVHRDIKPENILLHGGHAMVADFGIALAASRSDGGTRMTETGMSLGTPYYMAPEQAMGEREITPKADIYALGCVLYEMLTAEPPFTGATAQAIIARVMTEEPRSLTLQRHTIPGHVEAVVRRALEKLPADRFASAREFAAALGNPTFAGTASSSAVAAPSVRPPARRYAAAAAPWLLLAGVSGAWAWSATRPAAPPAVARHRIVLRDWPFVPGGLGRTVGVSPDGNIIVFPDTIGGTRQLWAKERGQLAAVPLSGTSSSTSIPAGITFSPDGAWIAFVQDQKLKKIPRLGGSAVTLADSANAANPAIAWLEGDTIVFNRSEYSLAAIGANGGPARPLLSVDSGWGAVHASPLPGGRAALVAVCRPGCTESELRVLRLDGGPVRTLVGDALKGWYIAAAGRVVFVREDGGVLGAPFALDTLAFTAPPAPVFEGVRTAQGLADMVVGAGGTLLYISGAAQTGGTPAEMVWVARDGAVTQVEAGWQFIPSSDFGFGLSPDGRRIALGVRGSDGQDIWIKTIDGPFTRLTFGGINIRPTWTADGRTVMYPSRRERDGVNVVRARRADGTGAETTLVRNSRSVFEIVRLRDTTRLLLRYTTPPSRDMLLARLGDSALTPLLAERGYDEVSPALSPDERWLAYVSNESGRAEVYVRPFPSVNSGRWQVSRNGGTEPVWANSGRELFYRDAGGNVVAVTVTPGATFATGAQRALFNARGLFGGGNHNQVVITPDDRRFLFMRLVGGNEATVANTFVVMVDHWFSELRGQGVAR